MWSHFSDTNGTTRAVIVEHFFQNGQDITSAEICSRVVNDIGRDMSEDEIKKFHEIQMAWDEWRYITSVSK